MKTLVITVLDDVCAKTGRDPEATALIEAARNFGKVESWEAAIAAEKAKYQETIDNLRRDLETIKEFSVTADELEILRALRKKSANEVEKFKAIITQRDEQLAQIQKENERRAEQIKSILGV